MALEFCGVCDLVRDLVAAAETMNFSMHETARYRGTETLTFLVYSSAALSFLAIYAVRVNFGPTHVKLDIEISKAIAPAGNSLVLFMVTVRFYFDQVVPRDAVRNARY